MFDKYWFANASIFLAVISSILLMTTELLNPTNFKIGFVLNRIRIRKIAYFVSILFILTLLIYVILSMRWV